MFGYVIPITLKIIVICDSVGASDLREQEYIFRQVGGVTIYVEALEEDLRWDDNFPGWSNGNVVVYGNQWHWVNFYGVDGELLSSEPVRNSQVIRRPVYELPTQMQEYDSLGWDLDDDGIADSIPATSTVDIHAHAICVKHEHDYESVIVDPSCTAEGSITYTCHCGDTYTEEIPALSHDYADGICTRCGKPDVLLGDVNGDGRINVRDARAILRYIAGLIGEDELEVNAADFNGDGRVNVRDARAILNYIAGMG